MGKYSDPTLGLGDKAWEEGASADTKESVDKGAESSSGPWGILVVFAIIIIAVIVIRWIYR